MKKVILSIPNGDPVVDDADPIGLLKVESQEDSSSEAEQELICVLLGFCPQIQSFRFLFLFILSSQRGRISVASKVSLQKSKRKMYDR